MTEKDKNLIKQEIVDGLKNEPEICSIFIFGTFIDSSNPNDIDIAIIQDSDEDYLTLALKYRKRMRTLAYRMAVDVIPVRQEASGQGYFLKEIFAGEKIYEK